MQLLPWSAYSPDMSLIEHLRDLVGRRFARDPRPAASKDKLLLRIQAIWNSLPQADIRNLFDSMPRRIVVLIAAHGGYINGDRYRAMITNFFIPELNNHDVQELWFQQDSATCHTARATIDLLKDTFGDRLISRFGPLNWPPRSRDLTPLDYFL
ncbi:uncharacterized protein TNCV_594841 [Trichonephila clavipes]|nr:uncharacterized protein TNCV_594841 [Trichonephila clavipes]